MKLQNTQHTTESTLERGSNVRTVTREEFRARDNTSGPEISLGAVGNYEKSSNFGNPLRHTTFYNFELLCWVIFKLMVVRVQNVERQRKKRKRET